MWSGIKSPDLFWRNLIPVVMAGVNGIYGLITSIILIGAIVPPSNISNNYQYSMYTSAAHLAAGLCCGLSALGSGMAIGIAGDAAVMACGTLDFENKQKKSNIGVFDFENKQGKTGKSGGKNGSTRGRKKKSGGSDKLFVSMVLIQVFAGNVALYGLIASILLSQQVFYCDDL